MDPRPESSERPLDEQRARPDRRRAVRLLLAGVAVVVAVVFMAQNNQKVELQFLFLEVTSRVWVGLLATLVLGAVLGQAAEALLDRRKRRRSADR